MSNNKKPMCEKWLMVNTNIHDDTCEINWKKDSNKRVSDYAFGSNSRCNPDQDYLCQVGLQQNYPSMFCGDIEYNSRMRNGCAGNVMTHTKSRQSLETRPYRTIPYMGECRAPLMDTNTFSKLSHWESSRVSKSCNNQIDMKERWFPLEESVKKDIYKQANGIPKHFIRGGMSTSSFYRNADYLRQCGVPVNTQNSMFCPDIDVPHNVKRDKLQGRNLPYMKNGLL